MTYIPRSMESSIIDRLNHYPVVSILGPRQCGKSTLAKQLLRRYPNSLYLDLELPSDERKLTDAEGYLNQVESSLVCIDEIQRRPELFTVLRALSDRSVRSGRFLLLGSAGPDLLRQSSESLAGRISYQFLTPFRFDELGSGSRQRHWLRGGFPRSWLAEDEHHSYRWRLDFILTYLERDLPSLGIVVDSTTARRLWTMLSHNSGQIINKSKLGGSLGIDSRRVDTFLTVLEKSFMVRVLPPYAANVKKRLVKSPKVYLRDTGILHALLEIPTFDALSGHPIYGQSWESYAIEQILSALSDWRASFYRTSDGTEIDLILENAGRTVAVEFKASTAPTLGAGFFHGLDAVGVDEAYVVCPFEKTESYPYQNGTRVASIDVVVEALSGADPGGNIHTPAPQK